MHFHSESLILAILALGFVGCSERGNVETAKSSLPQQPQTPVVAMTEPKLTVSSRPSDQLPDGVFSKLDVTKLLAGLENASIVVFKIDPMLPQPADTREFQEEFSPPFDDPEEPFDPAFDTERRRREFDRVFSQEAVRERSKAPDEPVEAPVPSPQSIGSFHDWPILERKAIEQAVAAQDIREILTEPSAYGKDYYACFDPGFGIRFEQESDVVDFVICLNCKQMFVYKNDKLERFILSEGGIAALYNVYDESFPQHN